MMAQQHLFDLPTPEGVDPRDCWRTPDPLYRRISAEHGPFRWDLAADASNTKCERFFSAADDALAQDWTQLEGPCFLNPPFGDLAPWVRKAAMTVVSRGAPAIVMLLPGHRCEQPWFHDWVLEYAFQVRFIAARTAYAPPPGVEASTPGFGSMVVVYEPGCTGETFLGDSVRP